MNERYSQLAPLSIELRATLAIAATNFFHPGHYQENCTIIGKTPEKGIIRPLSASDFLKYLEKQQILDEPGRYTNRIRQLLEQMASADILVEIGYSSDVFLPKMYYFLKELSSLQRYGRFWLAPALGDDFLYHLTAPAVVHIVGVNAKGDESAGTGIVFAPHHILTCAHVVEDINIKGRLQTFQNVKCRVKECFVHPNADIAVIRVDQPLKPVPGLSFLPPRIAQPVFALGYPIIPYVQEPALTMQRGEVTHELVNTYEGHSVFLYSAIARPGNSGGPIVSSDGHIVGISMQDLFRKDDEVPFSPHYAGIPSNVIAQCLNDLDVDVQIPIEDFS